MDGYDNLNLSLISTSEQNWFFFEVQLKPSYWMRETVRSFRMMLRCLQYCYLYLEIALGYYLVISWFLDAMPERMLKCILESNFWLWRENNEFLLSNFLKKRISLQLHKCNIHWLIFSHYFSMNPVYMLPHCFKCSFSKSTT